MDYKCNHRVRSYELDAYGHVNNAVYLHYLEFARAEYLRSIGFDYDKSLCTGHRLYITHISIDYKSPAFNNDELVITTRVVRKTIVSSTLSQVITRGKTVIAVAEVTWAFVNSKGTPARLTAEFEVPGLRP